MATAGYDLVVRGGEVVDGSGAPRRRADVGVRDGVVVAVGEVDGRGDREIDAEGRVVCPGFIDVHTHYDAQAFWDPALSPSPLHGVTTAIGGNCGFTLAPMTDEAAEYLVPMLSRVEGMPLASLQQGVPLNWRTTAEYLAALEGRLSINTGFLVGHSTVRRVVMGGAATERHATDVELDAMRRLVDDGLAAGALGFSSSWGRAHHDADGCPVPSRHASADELLALAAVCRDHPGTSVEFIPPMSPYVDPFDDEALDLMSGLSTSAQRPLNWNLLIVTSENIDVALSRLEAGDHAAARGGRVVALTMPMPLVLRYSFLTGFLLDLLPGWSEPMALPVGEKLALLRDPAGRARLRELAAADGPSARHARWGERLVEQTFTPETERFRGRITGDIAAELGQDPFDTVVDIACADDLRTVFAELPAPESPSDWEARKRVWTDDRTLIGASDAGAHLDLLTTFGYTTWFLERAVREQELLTLEHAVHLLTAAPAALYGIERRGVVAEGNHADLVVLDPATVAMGEVVTRFDLPGGAGRLYADAIGIDHVVVNGEPIVAGGGFTDAQAGHVLRSGRDTRTPSLAAGS